KRSRRTQDPKERGAGGGEPWSSSIAALRSARRSLRASRYAPTRCVVGSGLKVLLEIANRVFVGCARSKGVPPPGRCPRIRPARAPAPTGEGGAMRQRTLRKSLDLVAGTLLFSTLTGCALGVLLSKPYIRSANNNKVVFFGDSIFALSGE